MQVPKRIYDLLLRGVKAANTVCDVDTEVHGWLKSKGIDPDEISSNELLYSNSITLVTEPEAHMKWILEWIKEH